MLRPTGFNNIYLRGWYAANCRHLSSQARPSTLKTNGRQKWNVNEQKRRCKYACVTHLSVTSQSLTPRELLLNIWTLETSHFLPSQQKRHYLFTVPTFPKEPLKKVSAGFWAPRIKPWAPRTAASCPGTPRRDSSAQSPPVHTTQASRKRLFSGRYF